MASELREPILRSPTEINVDFDFCILRVNAADFNILGIQLRRRTDEVDRV